MVDIPTIEPFQFIRSTAFSERVQLANKLNEVIDALNQIGSVDDLQSQIDAINSEISEIQTAIGNTDTSLAELENQVNALVSQVNGLLKEVVSEVTLDSPGYGQVRVKVIHEDETETASNVLQIPVIQDGGITLISGTTDRSFKIQYITMDGVTHTTNDFVIPEGGGTDVTITSISILQGDTPNDIKFQVGLSDGSSIQSNSYPFPPGTELTPATTSQLGGVKIGANVTVQADGTISVDLSPYALKTEIPDVSDFVTAEDVAADYQPKGDYLTKVPIGGTAIGGVKNGGNVTIDAQGNMNAPTTPAYTLPVGGTALGGVKNGGNVTIDAQGNMNAPTTPAYTLPRATELTLGGVKIGPGITVTSDGTISVTSSSTNITRTRLNGNGQYIAELVNNNNKKIISMNLYADISGSNYVNVGFGCVRNPNNGTATRIPAHGILSLGDYYPIVECDFGSDSITVTYIDSNNQYASTAIKSSDTIYAEIWSTGIE